MDFNYGDITDKMTNCCDEISDPSPIHVASRIARDHDPIEAGPFVKSDRIEKSWADEKLVIRSLFHSDQIVSGIGPRFTSMSTSMSTCNMCKYEYEYLINTWVSVRVLVDEYEYKSEYWSMIYILYRQQYCIFQSLTMKSSDS